MWGAAEVCLFDVAKKTVDGVDERGAPIWKWRRVRCWDQGVVDRRVMFQARRVEEMGREDEMAEEDMSVDAGDEDDFQALLQRGWGSGDFEMADPVLLLRPQDPSGGPMNEHGAIRCWLPIPLWLVLMTFLLLLGGAPAPLVVLPAVGEVSL